VDRCGSVIGVAKTKVVEKKEMHLRGWVLGHPCGASFGSACTLAGCTPIYCDAEVDNVSLGRLDMIRGVIIGALVGFHAW
jgi:hypothetical protein